MVGEQSDRYYILQRVASPNVRVIARKLLTVFYQKPRLSISVSGQISKQLMVHIAERKPIIYQTNPRGGCVASPPTISCETSGLAIRRNDRAYQFVHEANRVTTAIWVQRAWTTKRFYYNSRFLTIWNVKRKDLPKTRLLDIVQPYWLHFIILE